MQAHDQHRIVCSGCLSKCPVRRSHCCSLHCFLRQCVQPPRSGAEQTNEVLPLDVAGCILLNQRTHIRLLGIVEGDAKGRAACQEVFWRQEACSAHRPVSNDLTCSSCNAPIHRQCSDLFDSGGVVALRVDLSAPHAHHVPARRGQKMLRWQQVACTPLPCVSRHCSTFASSSTELLNLALIVATIFLVVSTSAA